MLHSALFGGSTNHGPPPVATCQQDFLLYLHAGGLTLPAMSATVSNSGNELFPATVSVIAHLSTLAGRCPTNATAAREKRFPFFRFACLALGPLVVLTGCATHTYQPATATPTQIRNSTVGYAGYELTVPEGFTVFNPLTVPPDPKASPFVAGVKMGYVAFLKRGGLNQFKKLPGQMFAERHLITSDTVAVQFTVSTWNTPMAFNQLSNKQMEDLLGHISTSAQRRNNPANAGDKHFIRLGDRRGISTTYHQQWRLPTGQTVPIVGELLVVPGQLNEAFEIEGLAETDHEAQMHQALRQMIANLHN